MKKSIIKILSLFTFLLSTIFLISTPSVHAASSSYSTAHSFTFSSDMDIDEGLDLIKPFILYQDENVNDGAILYEDDAACTLGVDIKNIVANRNVNNDNIFIILFFIVFLLYVLKSRNRFLYS